MKSITVFILLSYGSNTFADINSYFQQPHEADAFWSELRHQQNLDDQDLVQSGYADIHVGSTLGFTVFMPMVTAGAVLEGSGTGALSVSYHEYEWDPENQTLVEWRYLPLSFEENSRLNYDGVFSVGSVHGRIAKFLRIADDDYVVLAFTGRAPGYARASSSLGSGPTVEGFGWGGELEVGVGDRAYSVSVGIDYSRVDDQLFSADEFFERTTAFLRTTYGFGQTRLELELARTQADFESSIGESGESESRAVIRFHYFSYRKDDFRLRHFR